VVSAAARVICRHGPLAERDIVCLSHADIEVQVRRQFKRFPGLNDIKFSQKATDLQRQIASAPADQKAALQSQLKAVVANIQNDALKPLSH
jgi:hypothetical protein